MSVIRPLNPPRRHDTRRVSRTWRALTGGVVALAVIVLGDALFGDRGLVALSQKQQELERLTQVVAVQERTNAQLKRDAERLQHDPSAIEERARKDLNLVRPGEKLIIIRDVPAPNGAR